MDQIKDSLFYLEKIRDQTEKRSDYAVAKLLNITPQQVSHCKNKKSNLDNDAALKVGKHLGISPLEVIANIKASKTKDKEAIEEWKKLAEEISKK